jgi:adenine C2-methylase RlmN of 23S rRNA A2503 and tRNA A37
MTDLPFIYDLELLRSKKSAGRTGPTRLPRQPDLAGLIQTFWNAPDEFSNLPKALREQLGRNLRFEDLKPVRYLDSSDGQTRKTLFQLYDGRVIEAVLMKYGDPAALTPSLSQGEGEKHRRTLCILLAGGLRDGLCLLRHRADGLQTSPYQR